MPPKRAAPKASFFDLFSFGERAPRTLRTPKSSKKKPETTAKNVEKQPETTAEASKSDGSGDAVKKPDTTTEPAKTDGNGDAPKQPETAEDSAQTNDSGNPNGGNGGANDTTNAATNLNEVAEFTPEQDAKLLEMKADGKSTWKQIATELGKSPNELKKRFKELKANDNIPNIEAGGNKEQQGGAEAEAGGGEAEENGGGDEGGGEDANEVEVPDKKKDKGDKGKKSKSGNRDGVGRGSRAGPAFTLPQWKELTQDDLFSFEELQMLSELVRKNKNKGWLRIASQFYDRTGRRVHEDDIKERFVDLTMN